VNHLELVAAIVGAISVWLSVRQNIWSWPTAIVNVVL
jgi:nicotinamide mononucleotide transporter